VPKKDDSPVAEPVYRLRLKEGMNAAQFNSGGVEVELTEASPVFETTDPAAYLGARDLAFLEDES
jgi:hypothetical protein